MITVTLDELGAMVGASLGTTSWVEIDQTSIDSFARITRDEQWIHSDPRRAAAGPFGGPIAHGFLTLALCSHFVSECLEVDGVSMAINYGLERVRFPAPVPAGSRVRGQAELTAFDTIPTGAHAVIRVTVNIETGGKPACVADIAMRFVR